MSPRASVFLPLGVTFALAALSAAFTACVPTGSAPPYDAGPAPAQSSSFKASVNVMTAPFEDTFDRPEGGDWGAIPGAPTSTLGMDAGREERADGAIAEAGADASLLLVPPEQRAAEAGADAGDRRPSGLGANWVAMKTNAWRVENGRLCAENAHNHGIWLNRTLPINARIEFDAYALTDDGDLKAELWGDGRTYATGTSYTNATSYLAILGGWHNSIHALARLNEHGTDRLDIKVDKNSDDPRQRAIVRGQLYQFKVERTDGKTIRYSVNGIEYFSFVDPAPLTGQGHDRFGFNEWEAKVCFDNVKVTPL